MVITLTMKDKKPRKYDLKLSEDVKQLKRIITRAMFEKNTPRLKQAKKQLANIKNNPVATEQLQRIQDFIVSQNDKSSIKPKKTAVSRFSGKATEDGKAKSLYAVKKEISIKTQACEKTLPLSGEAVKKADKLPEEPLIADVHLFPRSEYYSRFHGTSAFAMDEPGYWGTYHRSESSRFFYIAGSRKNAQFSSPFVKKVSGTHSFYAHTGGFHSPFTVREYSAAFKLDKQVAEGTENVRDCLLLYKNHMAVVVVESFKRFEENEQKIRKKHSRKQYHIRPIVYAENNYPCVLIALPALNPMEAQGAQTAAAKYWQKHPKPFQRLLLCSFVAFLNVEAIRANIPIEMVLRASFGHNLPSVCETNNTFRINVGVVPRCYAELIGKALHQLNQTIRQITDASSPPANFDADFLSQVRIYNVKKLKNAISGKKRYKALADSSDFRDAEHSDEAFWRLYDKFCKKNKEKGRVGSASFVPVILENKSIWEVIRQAGDSMGKSVLEECFRQNGTEDWFVNQVMDALLTGTENPIGTALSKLLQCIRYNETVSMDYKKIHADLKKPKRDFPSLSFKSFYEKDPEFSAITHLLFKAFCTERPDEALYSALERAGTNFFRVARGSEKVAKEADYGSDSEFEAELSDEEPGKRNHISHYKLRVCAGMKAILLAQYGALAYLRSQGIAEYTRDVRQMYYEVEDALRLVDVERLKLNKIRATITARILHFDLNHCNATNADDNQTLQEKLDEFVPAVVIIDYTSATNSAVEKALQQCFSRTNVKLVIFVDSGLKNNQGGMDINPYGEVRICARNRKTARELSQMMRSGLSNQDKLVPKAHEKVRACKRRGMAFSLLGLFKTDKPRFQIVEENNALFPGKKP